MKKDFPVSLILFLVCLGLGGQARSQEYCLSATKFDDLQIEIKKWENALYDRRFADLDAFLNGLIGAFEKGEKGDDSVERWFRMFRKDSPALEPLHYEWIKQYPTSFAAHLAAAKYFHTVGHAKRGSSYAKDTTESQFKAMTASFNDAVSFLDSAEKLTKKPTLVIAERISLMKSIGERKDVLALYKQGEKMDPHNTRVKASYISATNPKWGGSVAELELVLQVLQTSSFPRDTKTYIEYLVWYELANYAEISEQFGDAIMLNERASQMCPGFEEPMTTLVNLYNNRKNYTGMRSAATRYVARRPKLGWRYARRAWANYNLSDYKSAIADANQASGLGDAYGTYLLGWFYDKGRTEGGRNPAKALELYTTAYQLGHAKARQDMERLRAELKR